MSKQLSFRARALDSTKCMPVFKADEVPELPDYAAINRAVPQMPTGMEKEEETEHHLQRALSAQQCYGTAERLVIPIPEIEQVTESYKILYRTTPDYKPPKQFIHVQPWGMDQEIPDYDMDSEDEQWLTKQSKNFKNLNLTPLKFENMMDRLEKGSGQTEHALIPQVKTEKRDGSTTNNPYVAFRRRTEKMQTRKNRKNDETSYEKMLKLRRDLNKALTILELMKRREKSKKELLKLTIEIVEKRYQMCDWDSKALAEALALRNQLPSLIPLQNQYLNREWGHKEEGFVKKKREYKKRKHKHNQSQQISQARPQLPQYSEEVLPADPGVYSSEDEVLSPTLSASEQEVEEDPDGIYAFRRKAGCSYHAPISDGLGSWPWVGQDDGGFGDKRFRYSLTSLNQPRRCVGLTRRRVGRGGRVILDRAFTDWDDYLSELDLVTSQEQEEAEEEEEECGWVSEYTRYIRDANVPHFRPPTPNEDLPSFGGWGGLNPAFRDSRSPQTSEFNVQSFQDHREQLLQMQRQQQEQLLKQETDGTPGSSITTPSAPFDHSFSSQPTSRFTLDSASAQFAASAVSTKDSVKPTRPVTLPTTTTASLSSTVSSSSSTQLPRHSPALTALMQQPVPVLQQASALTNSVSAIAPLTNGPSSKTCGLSTSPAANILQLNYPITPVSSSSSSTTAASTAAATTTATPAALSSALSSSLLSPTSLLSSPAPPTIKTAASAPNLKQLANASPATVPSSAISVSTVTMSITTPSTLLSKFHKTLAGRIPTAVRSGVPSVTAGARTAATTATTVLKIPNNNGSNNTQATAINRENHEPVNSIAKDQIVAMEVT